MCTVNPQPSQLVDPIKWDRRVPQDKMVVIPSQDAPQVYGPGSAITDEMYSEYLDTNVLFWPYDQEKFQIINNGMVIPKNRTLIAFIDGNYDFFYEGHAVKLHALKVGLIVDQTDVAIDEALLRLRTTQSR